MNGLFSEVWIEMSAEGDAEYIARLQRRLDELDAAEARMHAEHAARIKKLEMAEEMIIARVDDLYTTLAPGETRLAREQTLARQIALIKASHGSEPGAAPESRGGKRHKQTHKRTHKRAHRR
jgi:hypothetical protein